MSPGVKPKRRYESAVRQEQANRTRALVLDAARRHFLERGYAATTIAAIAADAGVSVETVYKAFGNKPQLVKAVFDVAVVGDDKPIPMMQREWVRRTEAEPDPRKKLIAYGAHVARASRRSGAIQLVVRDAAVSDAGAAEVWDQLQVERLTGMAAFASHLAAGGYLRDGVSVEQARDVLWVHNAVEMWDLLVRRREWSYPRFGRWIGQQLIAALL